MEPDHKMLSVHFNVPISHILCIIENCPFNTKRHGFEIIKTNLKNPDGYEITIKWNDKILITDKQYTSPLLSAENNSFDVVATKLVNQIMFRGLISLICEISDEVEYRIPPDALNDLKK